MIDYTVLVGAAVLGTVFAASAASKAFLGSAQAIERASILF